MTICIYERRLFSRHLDHIFTLGEMDMKKTKIIVADAQELVAEGLRARLSDIPEFEIVGHASTGTALLKALATHEVDLVLMEVSLPGMDGIDATRKLHEQFPPIPCSRRSNM